MGPLAIDNLKQSKSERKITPKVIADTDIRKKILGGNSHIVIPAKKNVEDSMNSQEQNIISQNNVPKSEEVIDR